MSRTPWVLALGIAAVSTASVLIRFAQEDAPSLVIAAGRLGFATLVLAVPALGHRGALRGLDRRDLLLGLAAGGFLALHFASWIASLEHTSVVSSVVLVTTTPLWVALLAPRVLGERPGAATRIGVAVALAGSLLIALGDAPGGAAPTPGPGPRALFGDLLALGGAWMMAGYLLIGRRLRARLPLVPYVFLVYGMAAVLLIVAAAAGGLALPRHGSTWGWILLLALVPQLLGHSSFNWALRHLPATFVAVALLGEPLGSSVLAFLVLHEVPGRLTLLGAALTLGGIVLVARDPGLSPEAGA